MQRQEFIMKSGMLLTSAILSAHIARAASGKNSNRGLLDRRPDPDLFEEPILKAISTGLNAPNPHNTQAWKFKILTDTSALFFIDETKLLPATDPPARQVHIGCGCFLALFRMGAENLGYYAVVDYFPEGVYDTGSIGKKPVARLTLQKSEKVMNPLFQYIHERQTNRSLYTGSFIRDDEFEKIIHITQPSFTRITLTNNKTKLIPLLTLLYKGMEVECYDWNAYDESRQWLRVKEDIAIKKDGITLRANGVSGIKLWFAETVMSNYSKKTWHNEASILSYLKTHYDVVMSSKGIVTFITETNTPMDWIKCGEDYLRFQLSSGHFGFCVQPLSQILQELPSMKKLGDEFNQELDIREPAKVQMVVRIGRAEPTFYSYRKNIPDFLQKN